MTAGSQFIIEIPTHSLDSVAARGNFERLAGETGYRFRSKNGFKLLKSVAVCSYIGAASCFSARAPHFERQKCKYINSKYKYVILTTVRSFVGSVC